MEEKKNLRLIVKPFDENRQFPVLGKPQELKPGIYGVKQLATVGKYYVVPCPKCDHNILLKAETPGVFRTLCKGCKTIVIARGGSMAMPTAENKDEETRNSGDNTPIKNTERSRTGKNQLATGKLVWGRLIRKTYFLHEGDNYIGREDEEQPSDVSLKDAYASRRSVKINVLPGEKGNSYKLTIENATNPVLINGAVQTVGNSVYLNFGDTIVLGNTTIIFKEAKK